MTFTHVRYWLLASAFIVVLAATLLIVAVPVQAGAPYCYGIPRGNGCYAQDWASCNELRAMCRQDPEYQAWKRDAHDILKQICGPSTCVSPEVW